MFWLYMTLYDFLKMSNKTNYFTVGITRCFSPEEDDYENTTYLNNVAIEDEESESQYMPL